MTSPLLEAGIEQSDCASHGCLVQNNDSESELATGESEGKNILSSQPNISISKEKLIVIILWKRFTDDVLNQRIKVRLVNHLGRTMAKVKTHYKDEDKLELTVVSARPQVGSAPKNSAWTSCLTFRMSSGMLTTYKRIPNIEKNN